MITGNEEKMNLDRQHKMVLVHESEDGSQEWFCPDCGRHLLITWPPNYKRTVIEPGDEEAIHSGSTGGLSMGPTDAGEASEIGFQEFSEPESAEEFFDLESLSDPYLEPFQRFFEESHF
jgi:hypothetical protein